MAHSQKAKDIITGKGEDWRDKTHFRMCRVTARADLVVWLPLMAAGSIGVLLGHACPYSAPKLTPGAAQATPPSRSPIPH